MEPIRVLVIEDDLEYVEILSIMPRGARGEVGF